MIRSLIITLFFLALSTRSDNKCNKQLRRLFLKDAGTTPHPEPTANQTLQMVCGSNPDDSEGQQFCCSLSEFKELYLQFHDAKIKLVRTRAKIKRFFDFYRNLEKTEFARLVNVLKSQASVKKCVGSGYAVAINDINKSSFLQMLQGLNSFFDWKIEQMSSLLCLVCSPIHPNYTIQDPIEMTLMTSLAQCQTDFQKYSDLENVVYYIVNFLTMVKGVKCSRGEELPNMLKNLRSLAEWKDVIKDRDQCLDPRASLHDKPQCADAYQGAANMMYFPMFEELNFMSEYLFEFFQSFFAPTPKMVPQDQQVSTVSTDELNILNNQSFLESAQWDFKTFTLYNSEEKWPIRLNTACNYQGIKWTKYKMNMDKTNGFIGVLSKKIEEELKAQQEKLKGDVENQYEASYLGDQRSEFAGLFGVLYSLMLSLVFLGNK